MSTVLVTGGAGFIGSHTCKMLAENGYTPVVYDNLSRGHVDFVRWGPLVRGDILDDRTLDDAFSRFRPEAVIHFAALAYVGESFPQALAYYRNNVAGLVNVLTAMVRHNISRIVFSSSCAIYGIPETVPITEQSPQRPISPYGHSKLACERIIKDVASAHGLQFALLRYFNACGADPEGTLVERHDPETHLIPLAIDAAAGRGPPLSVFGTDYPTRDGTCERDYVHVTDLAKAHVRALALLGERGTSFAVNLGTGRSHSVLEVIAAVEQVSGRRVPFIPNKRRLGDPPTLVADVSRAQELLRFSPTHSDIETIAATAWKSRTV